MPEVPINIRCSDGDNLTIQVDLTSTVLVLKQKIADRKGVSPNLQRLIYKGRVMNNDESTLENYEVETKSTVHYVRTRVPVPASGPSAGATPAPSGAASPVDGPQAGSQRTPRLADMFGDTRGGVDINRMQQQLMSNPEMMANIMNSPMMAGLLNNPDMLRNIMFSNPQMQQVMENNPQIAQVLNDPAMMRQYLEMARNPEAMNQARRSQDLMMSQIENQPGGFNALRRLYTDIQEPLMQASDGMASNNENSTEATNSSESSTAAPSAGPNTSALPNPWAPAGANTPAAATTATGTAAQGGINASNPWAALGGGGTGLPNLASIPAMPGMGIGGGHMDPAMMAEMMNNPMVQQVVNQMADDPALMESMLEQNPAVQQAVQANPAMRAQLPHMMRQMADPQNAQAIAQMQSAMQQLQRAGIVPLGMPGVDSSGVGGTGDANTGSGEMGGMGPGLAGLANFGRLNVGRGNPSPASTGGLDFSSLLGTGLAGSGSAGGGTNPWASTTRAPTPAPAVANPREAYATELEQMNDMGFTNSEDCVRALVASQGDVNAAVERMLSGGV